jgi:PAS domain S-box-containing protein
MALSDCAGIVLAATPAYYDLYGYGPDEVVGSSFALIFPNHQRAAAEAQYQDVFRAELPPPMLHSVVTSKSGEERVVEVRLSFIDDDGQRVAMLSILRDVTAEVTARRAAALAERELRAVLFSLSHDIKSPLSVIKGHAQVLRRHVARRAAAPPTERLVESLVEIESSALRVAGLLDELVELAGLPEGTTPPLHASSIDLVELVRDAVSRQGRLAERHQFVLDFEFESLSGVWDGPRLMRVLENLLSNAVKYSPAGGVITVGLRRQAAAQTDTSTVPTPASGQGSPGVHLWVEDDGIGIEAGDLPHVFDRFYRGVNVPDAVVGSGIGLTSVQHIVQQHGGTISITSSADRGTRANVWLPVCQDKEVDPRT